MKRLFEKNGKLERLYPIYEMVETILFVKPVRTAEGAHIRDNYDIKRMMAFVIFAAMPAFLYGMYNAGYQYYLSQGVNASVSGSFISCFLITAKSTSQKPPTA